MTEKAARDLAASQAPLPPPNKTTTPTPSGAKPQSPQSPPTMQRAVVAAIAYYSLCSSCLLIVNKVALHILPAPVLLLSAQLWFAVFFVYALRVFNFVHVEPLSWATAAKFSPVVISFLGTLFSNAKVLQYSNVETFITFRASTPLVLCICDYIFLGRHLPSRQSVLCLVGLLASGAGYACFDHAFDVRAYSWLAVWFACFTAYEVVVKHLCDSVSLDNWTRVVYTNTMAGAMLALAVPFVRREHVAVAAARSSLTLGANLTLLASCLIGIGVSHSAYAMRSVCSATLSAVVGIVCKVLTVLINILLWDKHAEPTELAFLALGLVCGALYEQAPLRKREEEKENDDVQLKTGSNGDGRAGRERAAKSESSPLLNVDKIGRGGGLVQGN